jgi:hypothetical protein
MTARHGHGAQHAYDNPASPPLFDIPKAQSTRNCRLEEGPTARS